VIIDTRHGPMRKAFATNPTTAGVAVTTPADTITDPYSTDGNHRIGRGGSHAPNSVFVKPFGVGADTTTFLMALFAIDRIINKTGTHIPDQWTYTLLASFTCTNSTPVGLANGIVVATERYCDTIAVIDGNANVSHEALSPEGDNSGHVVVDLKGAEGLAFRFWMNGSATSANALFRPM
jgi:hypothetical protein